MPQSVETDCVQLVIYIKRNATLTPSQFYDHWQNVHSAKVIPWAEKHGIRRYQQIHVAGRTVSADFNSTPGADSPLVEFDGIAMFTVPSLDHFKEAFKDPYYRNVIEPDERFMLDTEGVGGGAVAKFVGPMFDMVNGMQSAVGVKGKEYRDAWEEHEKKCRP